MDIINATPKKPQFSSPVVVNLGPYCAAQRFVSSQIKNHGHNVFIPLYIYKVFLSLQVKRSVIIINKHGTWYIRVSSRVAKRSQEIREYEKNLRTLQNDSLAPSPLLKGKSFQYQQKPLEKSKLNFSRSGLFHKKTRVYRKYFVHHCL